MISDETNFRRYLLKLNAGGSFRFATVNSRRTLYLVGGRRGGGGEEGEALCVRIRLIHGRQHSTFSFHY